MIIGSGRLAFLAVSRETPDNVLSSVNSFDDHDAAGLGMGSNYCRLVAVSWYGCLYQGLMVVVASVHRVFRLSGNGSFGDTFDVGS